MASGLASGKHASLEVAPFIVLLLDETSLQVR